MLTHLSPPRREALRHSCLACGGACQAVVVPVIGAEERARIESLGAQLGVPEPVVNGRQLRMVGGRCVFLGEDELCRLHGTFGSASKPAVCSQFPLLVLRVGESLRVGIDPTCFTAYQTWRDGPPVSSPGAMTMPVPLDPSQEPIESRLISVLESEDAGLGMFLRAVAGEPQDGDKLPTGFATRLITAMQASPLEEILHKEGVGRAIPGALAPLRAALPTWSASSPPPWPPENPEIIAWGVESVRRTLFLRTQAAQLPVVAGVALLAAAGGVACAWACPEPKDYARALAGWLRLCRTPMYWARLMPTSAAMHWLIRGVGEAPTASA
jgi:Fe-S-cluster containining protein